MNDIRRRGALLFALAALAAAPAAAGAAPAVTDWNVTPGIWSRSGTAGVSWEQVGFEPAINASAHIQVRPAGGDTWTTRATLPGPLVDGVSVVGLNVADLEGVYDVRLVIAGLDPVALGTLRLDRTAPDALDPVMPPAGRVLTVIYTQADAGVGSDPHGPIVLEMNAAADGTGAGAWVPAPNPPPAGDGRRGAVFDVAALAEGRHLVRVTSRDTLGNTGTRLLGTAIVDRTPPAADRPVALPVDDPRQLTRRMTLAVDPGTGSAIADVTVAPADAPDDVDWSNGTARQTLAGGPPATITLPGPGTHLLVVRARDEAGNTASSPLTAVTAMTEDEYRAATAPPPPPPPDTGGPSTALPAGTPGPTAGRPAGAGVRFAWRGAVRFHARRGGPALAAKPRVVRRSDTWRALLGGPNAAQYAGYTTRDGTVLLGPAATGALEALQRARTARPRARRPSRADLDRMASGLAVLLHESLHATGPAPPTDYHDSPSSRALEEALTEAATADLLRAYVASLRLPAALRPRLVAAARRYRPAYRPQVQWLRRLSTRATGRTVHAPVSVAWRVTAADTYGDDRWEIIAGAVRTPVVNLRSLIPPITRAR